MKKQVIIFDFDGTLADVVPIFKKIYGKLAIKYGLKQINDQQYIQLRKKPVWKIMLYIGLKPWHLEGLLRDGRRLFAEQKNSVELFDNIPELIKNLHKNGHKLYVLSSNRERTIRLILDRYNLNDELIIMQRPKFFGKARSIKRLKKSRKYSPKNMWMIGDEVRDLRAGKRAGIKTISVTWGLQSREILAKKTPDFIADTVDELRKILIKH